MASVNKVILLGNLGKDPETRYTAGGDPICNITIATSDSYKDKATGEKKEITEWHRVVFFNRLAEIAGQYLKKGRPVYVEGRIRTRKWQDQSGQERYTTEIVADSMQLLGGRDGGGGGGGDAPMSDEGCAPSGRSQSQAPAQSSAPKKHAPSFDDMDDDIPF